MQEKKKGENSPHVHDIVFYLPSLTASHSEQRPGQQEISVADDYGTFDADNYYNPNLSDDQSNLLAQSSTTIRLNNEQVPTVGHRSRIRKSRAINLFRYLFSINLLHHNRRSVKKSSELTRFQRFQRDLAELLESHWAQVLIIALLVVDMFVTTAELLLDVYEKKHSVARRKAHLALYIVGVCVLGLFVIEVFMKMVAFGWRFITKIMFVFDALIVFASFGLEIYYGMSEGLFVGLLIMLRFWRVIRIIYGVAYTAQVRAEERINRMKVVYAKENEQLKSDLARVQQMLQSQNQRCESVGKHLQNVENSLDINNNREKTIKDQIVQAHVLLF